MVYRRLIALVLVAVWASCVFHSTLDRATAHWHVQESGQSHHHHHPIGESPSHHHPDGEPLGGHSHETGVVDCCSVEALRASYPELKPIVESLQAEFVSIVFKAPSVDWVVPYYQLDLYDKEKPDLRWSILTLHAPNAPPLYA